MLRDGRIVMMIMFLGRRNGQDLVGKGDLGFRQTVQRIMTGGEFHICRFAFRSWCLFDGDVFRHRDLIHLRSRNDKCIPDRVDLDR